MTFGSIAELGAPLPSIDLWPESGKCELFMDKFTWSCCGVAACCSSTVCWSYFCLMMYYGLNSLIICL